MGKINNHNTMNDMTWWKIPNNYRKVASNYNQLFYESGFFCKYFNKNKLEKD